MELDHTTLNQAKAGLKKPIIHQNIRMFSVKPEEQKKAKLPAYEEIKTKHGEATPWRTP